MSVVFNSGKTADTINRAIDNNQGTTTTAQGAAAAGKIINEDLSVIVQGTNGYTNPLQKKTVSGEPPLTFHAVDAPLPEWSISGNADSGDYVGDLTLQLFDKTAATTGKRLQASGMIDDTLTFVTDYINVENVESIAVSSKPTPTNMYFYPDNTSTTTSTYYNGTSTTIPAGMKYVRINGLLADIDSFMVNTGTTAKPWEPYDKYKIPIKCGGITTNLYIGEPLRMSSGESPVCDIMYSSGSITRNVDSSGDPLETPTTDTYDPETINTVWGYNTFDVDTTVSPSSVSVTYIDN